jgi:acyltransferase
LSLAEVSLPGKPRRIPTLDAARALGVVAMVVGHTVDALLSTGLRDEHASVWVATYWKARGLTAPLFMLVAGWAVTVAIGRSGSRGVGLVRSRLPRVALLLAIGLALRWPGWGLDRLSAGDPEVWAHLLAFDALHTIALSLLAAAAVLALPLPARERVLAFALLVVVAVTLGMRAPAPLVPAPGDLPAAPAALALAQVVGGTSPFPLFPWSVYFFAGCLVGLLAGDGRGRYAAALAGLGGALVAATAWTGVGIMPPGDPRLIAFRIGAVLLVLALLSRVPAGIAARLAPLGRASLGVYAIHVPIVYGWSTQAGLAQRIGPALPFPAAAGIALAVLAASFALHLALVTAWRGARGLRNGAREGRIPDPG